MSKQLMQTPSASCSIEKEIRIDVERASCGATSSPAIWRHCRVMKFSTYEHLHARSIADSAATAEVLDAVQQLNLPIARLAAPKIRAALLDLLYKSGWPDEVLLAPGSTITVTSMKNRVGLCLQTGNYARVYADLLKLQKLFVDGAINVGLLIVPSDVSAKLLGDNLASSARLQKELRIFQNVITCPILVVAIEGR